MIRLFSFILVCILISNVYAHSGKTDATGGHYITTDTYHCHAAHCIENLKSTFNRKEWKHWVDSDKDCKNTRAEILELYSDIPVTFKTIKKCRVISGEWTVLYTGKTFTKASDLDINHVVPLYQAHIRGGSMWSNEKKKKFANDMTNLLPVDASTNVKKGAKNPTEWKPRKGYWNRYALKWIIIQKKYKLHFSKAENKELRKMMLEKTGESSSEMPTVITKPIK